MMLVSQEQSFINLKNTSVTASANFFCTNCIRAKGTPNCFLFMVYSRAVSKQSSAAPKTPHEIPYLALFKHPKGPI